MGFILDISLCVRLLSLFILGGIVGGQINRGIYRLAVINPRQIDPWSRPDANAPVRRWFDRLPIVGWFGLRREEPIHGRLFWVRPLLIESFAAIGFAWLHYWEINGGLLPAGANPAAFQTSLHVHYLLHIKKISESYLKDIFKLNQNVQSFLDGFTIITRKRLETIALQTVY